MMLSCNAVRDLLPSYLDRLTSPQTDAEMEEHLRDCPECQAVRDAMQAEIKIDHAPKTKLDLLKKLRMKQIIGAVLSAVITLICMYTLYSGEFSVDVSDTAALEAAINRYIFSEEVSANVLESRRIGDRLVVLFEREGYDGHYGIAWLESGIFGKYRIQKTNLLDRELYGMKADSIDGKDYLFLYGIHDLPGVATYAVYPGDDTSAEPDYQGAVEEAPFLRVVEIRDAEQYGGLPLVHYYDADGNEIPQGMIQDAIPDPAEGNTPGTASMEPNNIYLFLAIVLILGIVMVRYFLIP